MRIRPTLTMAALSAGVALACGGEDLTGPGSGQVRVTTATSGSLPDPDGYALLIDGAGATPVGTNATLAVTVPEGSRTVELTGVAATCLVEGEVLRTVDVRAGATTDVEYRVTCAGQTALAVTTTTSGAPPGIDAYALRIDDGPERPIGTSATLVLTDLAAGPHSVALVGVPERCVVEGVNPATVEVIEGQAAVLEFAVACSAVIRSWNPIPVETTADLTNVWGTSATDVLTVGERDIPGGIEGLIFRYDGTRWTRELRANDLRVRGLWGSGPSDVYAVGYGFFSGLPSVLHYDGTMWSGAPGFQSDGLESAGFEAVWGSARDDVFAVGFTADGAFETSLIYHFDGTRWDPMPVEGEVDPFLSDVWGSSGTDVYAVGQDDFAEPTAAVILRYDGTGWRVVEQAESVVLNAVWGSSASDVFAVGFQVTESDDGTFEVRGVVWHYDGAGWAPMDLPPVGVLRDVAGRSPTEVYVVGDDGVILRFDGVEWTVTRRAERPLLGVWLAPGLEGFAVGTRGTALRGE
jgi:hypothetical protein